MIDAFGNFINIALLTRIHLNSWPLFRDSKVTETFLALLIFTFSYFFVRMFSLKREVQTKFKRVELNEGILNKFYQ